MAASVMDVFMLFGDSITQGAWVEGGLGQRLSHVYARRLDCLNRGFSGYNTEWGIPVFEQCIATQHEQKHIPKVKLLTVWFGANDACVEPSPQHVPITKFASNIKHIVNLVKSPTSVYYSPDTNIILMTPPPVNTFQRDPNAQVRFFETTKAYAETVKLVASEAEVALVDVWTLLWDAAQHDEKALEKYLYDGLHLNVEGYALVYDALLKTIGARYPDIYPDKVPFVFPPWSEIDFQNPGQSLKKKHNEGK